MVNTRASARTAIADKRQTRSSARANGIAPSAGLTSSVLATSRGAKKAASIKASDKATGSKTTKKALAHAANGHTPSARRPSSRFVAPDEPAVDDEEEFKDEDVVTPLSAEPEEQSVGAASPVADAPLSDEEEDVDEDLIGRLAPSPLAPDTAEHLDPVFNRDPEHPGRILAHAELSQEQKDRVAEGEIRRANRDDELRWAFIVSDNDGLYSRRGEIVFCPVVVDDYDWFTLGHWR